MIHRESPTKIVLVCGGKKCCPVVERDDASGDIVVADDFGGRARIPESQAAELARAIEMLAAGTKGT